MATVQYRNTHTNQHVYVPEGFFTGNPLWELVGGAGGGGGVTPQDLAAAEADTTGPHGVADFSALATASSVTQAVSTHNALTAGVHGITNTGLLETQAGAQAKVNAAVVGLVPSSQLGVVNGIATLGSDGKLAAGQAPAFGASVDAAAITSGTMAVARLPVGTGASTVAAGNDGRIVGAVQTTQLGVNSGVATLGSDGKLATAQVPAFGGTITGEAIVSGTVAVARLPVGTAVSTVAAGDDTRIVNAVAKGTLMLNVKDYGALGNNTGNDSTAIQAAIDATQAVSPKGGIVLIPRGVYRCTTPIVLNNAVNVILQGHGGRSGGSATATQVLWAGSDAAPRFLELRDTAGATIRDMMIFAASGTFTGRLIDVRLLTFGGAYTKIDNCWIGGSSGGSFTGIDFDQATRAVVSSCAFYGCAISVRGLDPATVVNDFSNQITIRDCGFNQTGVAAIRNPGQAWTIRDCTFEGSASLGVANAMDHEAGMLCEGLLVEGCWSGDTASGTQYKVAGSAITFQANWVGVTGGTGINIDAPSTGVTIMSNSFAGAVTAINLSAACTGETIRGNAYVGVTTRLAGALSYGASYGDSATMQTSIANPAGRPLLSYSYTHEVQTNEALNGGFDTDLSFWFNTSVFLCTAANTFTRITSDWAPLGGSVHACAQVTYDNTAAQRGVWQGLAGLEPDTTYWVSAFIKVLSGTSVALRMRDSTNTVLAADSARVAAGDGWVQVRTSLTTGSTGPVLLQYTAVSNVTTANGSFLFDDVRFGKDVGPSTGETYQMTQLRRAIAATGLITDQTSA